MTERNTDYRSVSSGDVCAATGVVFSSLPAGAAQRSLGGFGGKPPLGGGFPPNPPPLEDGQRSAAAGWLMDNLPTVSAFANMLRAEFGEVRLVFASENGHVLGKPGPDGVRMSDTVVGRMFADRPAKGR